MKKIILLGALLSTLGACKKEQNSNPLIEVYDTSVSTLVSQASFNSNAHITSGTVKLYSEGSTKKLVFENFKTDNGPDLRVYLSTTTGISNFVELGTLKATTGSFNYNVDNSINTSTYKYVLIWCEDFSVLFGNAALQ